MENTSDDAGRYAALKELGMNTQLTVLRARGLGLLQGYSWTSWCILGIWRVFRLVSVNLRH